VNPGGVRGTREQSRWQHRPARRRADSRALPYAHRQLGRKRTRDLARDGEQVGLAAALQLHLDLAQRQRGAAGLDAAAVERQSDGTGPANEGVERPPHARFEDRPELAAKLLAEERRQGGSRRAVQIRLGTRNVALPFITREDVGILRRLDRLHITAVAVTHAQHQPSLAELAARRIKIDRHFRLALGRRSAKKRELFHKRRRGDRKLELDLAFDSGCHRNCGYRAVFKSLNNNRLLPRFHCGGWAAGPPAR
jgi:hypothetical protein